MPNVPVSSYGLAFKNPVVLGATGPTLIVVDKSSVGDAEATGQLYRPDWKVWSKPDNIQVFLKFLYEIEEFNPPRPFDEVILERTA